MDGGGAGQRPLKIFHPLSRAMAMPLSRCTQKFLARPFRPRPQKKVRGTPLLPCAMPKDGKRGSACALAVRSAAPAWGCFNGWDGVSVSLLSVPRCAPVCISLLCPDSYAPYRFERFGYPFLPSISFSLRSCVSSGCSTSSL